MSINDMKELSDEAKKAIHDMFTYHKWGNDEINRGNEVRNALMNAMYVIVVNVPPCPDRSTAIRKLREARADCNSAITHNGKY